LGTAIGQRDEFVVLGNEVGFAIDFDNGTLLAVSGDADSDDAFSRDTGCSLARLVAELDTEDLFSLAHVAIGFGQGLLAFHHGCVGLAAQFCHHACGNCRHIFSPELLEQAELSAPPLQLYSAASTTSTNSSSPPAETISCMT
jgi:hypothetical protein